MEFIPENSPPFSPTSQNRTIKLGQGAVESF